MPRVRRHPATSHTSDNPNRKVSAKHGSTMRSKSTIKRLNMYRQGAPVRNKQGQIVGGDLMSRTQTANKPMESMARIAPNRRWFGNTRVISQKELDDFRERMTETVSDPYTVLLRRKNLPLGLLLESGSGNGGKAIKGSLLELEADRELGAININKSDSFASVFGPKKTRKRPNVAASNLADLLTQIKKKSDKYDENKQNDTENVSIQQERQRIIAREEVFSKGQSKRIWQELYKVIDCSDVVIQVLDCRDPFGTRSTFLETHIKTNCPHKHLIFVLNKVDLVPNYLSKHYIKELSKDYPTLAFHASLTKPFGKGSLIQLLRQFSILHPEKKQISVGFVGFPNVGKSSIINAIKSKKVCKVAPIPGETKVWQYITLFKNVFLIDCPGIVYPDKKAKGDEEEEKFDGERKLRLEAELIIKGVVRAERLDNPEEYISYILDKVTIKNLIATYGVEEEDCVSSERFLRKLAIKRGRLLKGGEPDFRSVAQQVIYDLQRGKIAYYVVPKELQDKKKAINT